MSTLTDRLRHLADELDSAERYGVPLPEVVNADGLEYGGVGFHITDPADFEAWADYTEAEVTDYENAGRQWRRTSVDVNGVEFKFSTCLTTDAEQVSA